jgi:hypothetical protein
VRPIIAVVVGFFIAILIAWLGVEIIEWIDTESDGDMPDFLDTAWVVLCLVAWAVWAFGDSVGGLTRR